MWGTGQWSQQAQETSPERPTTPAPPTREQSMGTRGSPTVPTNGPETNVLNEAGAHAGARDPAEMADVNTDDQARATTNPPPAQPQNNTDRRVPTAPNVPVPTPPPTMAGDARRLNPSETQWRRMRHVNDDGSWTQAAHEFRAYACTYFSRSTHVCGHASGITSEGSNQYFLRLKCSTCKRVIYRAAMNRS